MRTMSLAAREGRPLLEVLEPRILLDGTPEAQALELFSISPALFVENQGQSADEVPGVSTGGAALASLVSILGSADPLFADSVWTGAGSTPNWSDAANWNTGTVPLATDSVIFDVTSVGESRIDAGFGGTIASITINGYEGNIYQDRSLAITGDYSQSSGGFISPTNLSFSVGESFSIPTTLPAGFFYRFTGTGDVNNPILVYDVYGLQGMKNGAALYFKLNNNIDASVTIKWHQGPGREGFSPIGGTTDSMFYHSVDGDGHTISNLYINITDLSQTNVGLFGYINIAINNLGLVNCSITGPGYIVGTYNYTGSIAGWNKGTISNCYNTGSVSSESYSGGLAGRNQGAISNCYNSGNISGVAAGGLTGYNYGSCTISNCYNTGNISGNSKGGVAGGLAGHYNYGTISNSYNTGSVSAGVYGIAGAGYAGGLVVQNIGTISNCYNTGTVSQIVWGSSGGWVGGLAGWNQGTISNSYNAGSVSGRYNVGGLVGYYRAGKICNSYNISIVGGGGGLIGYHFNDQLTVSNCGWWTGAAYGPGTHDTPTYNEPDKNVFKNPSHGVYTDTTYNTFNPWDFSAIWDMYDGSSFPFFRWQVSFAPTDITLSGTSVAENQPVGTVVGVLSGTDPDPGQSETLVFTLEPGYGDNALFQISGNQLQTVAVFDYEARNSYSIMVRATDTGSPALTYDEPFTLNVIDLEEIAPHVMSVNLNDRPGRTVSDIEPSGIGVRTIDIQFSEAVFFDSAAVDVKAVEFSTGQEQERPGALPAVAVTGSGTNVMTITLGDPAGSVGAVDTWVKVTLAAAGITDAAGNALDGEPENDSSGLGYIYDAVEDLPSGDGVAGGDALFYVGSLRGDMRGFGPFQPDPNGIVDQWDINGFTSKYTQGNIDADFRGFGPFQPEPNGIVDQWDINGFTSKYTQALMNGTRLWPLPVVPEGAMAIGSGTEASALAGPLAVEPVQLLDKAPLSVPEPVAARPAAVPGMLLPVARGFAMSGGGDEYDAATTLTAVRPAVLLSPWVPVAPPSPAETPDGLVDLLAVPALEVPLGA